MDKLWVVGVIPCGDRRYGPLVGIRHPVNLHLTRTVTRMT